MSKFYAQFAIPELDPVYIKAGSIGPGDCPASALHVVDDPSLLGDALSSKYVVPRLGYDTALHVFNAYYTREQSNRRNRLCHPLLHMAWRRIVDVELRILGLVRKGEPYPLASDEEVLEQLTQVKEKSPGFPWNRVYKKKDEVPFTTVKSAVQARLARRAPYVMKIFFKDELIKTEKAKEQRYRAICAGPIDLYATSAYAGLHWHAARMQARFHAPFKCGLNVWQEFEFVWRVHSPFALHLEIDLRGSEFSFTVEYFERMFALRRRLSHESVWPYLDEVEAALCEKLVAAPFGKTDCCPNLLPSGVYDTTVLSDNNTLWHAYAILASFNPHFRDGIDCQISVFGDNLLLSVSSDFERCGVTAEAVVNVAATLGVRISAISSPDLLKVSFLSHSWQEHYGIHYPYNTNYDKILISSIYTKFKVGFEEKHANKLYSILRDVVFGPAPLYQQIHGVCTRFLSKHLPLRDAKPIWGHLAVLIARTQMEARDYFANCEVAEVGDAQSGTCLTIDAALKSIMPTKHKKEKAKKKKTHKKKSVGKLKGHGDYSSVGAGIGKALGSGVDGFVDGVKGIGKLFGFGDYSVKKNSITAGTSGPPTFAGNDKGIKIVHREFIADVISPGSAFNVTPYSINPGLATSFPFLSTIASAFEQYEFEGLVYEFKTTSATAVGSTNTALGVVIMATNYDVLDSNFLSKTEMEAYMFCTSGVTCESTAHAIECARSETSTSVSYVRRGTAPADADLRLYDLGKFQVATMGQQAGCTIGELWVTYSVRLMKPRLSSPIGDLIPCCRAASVAHNSGTQPASATVNTTSTMIVPCVNGVLTFPFTGRYFFSAFQYLNTGTYTTCNDFSVFSGCANAGGYNNFAVATNQSSRDFALDVYSIGATLTLPLNAWSTGTATWGYFVTRIADTMGATDPNFVRVPRRFPRLGYPSWVAAPRQGLITVEEKSWVPV